MSTERKDTEESLRRNSISEACRHKLKKTVNTEYCVFMILRLILAPVKVVDKKKKIKRPACLPFLLLLLQNEVKSRSYMCLTGHRHVRLHPLIAELQIKHRFTFMEEIHFLSFSLEFWCPLDLPFKINIKKRVQQSHVNSRSLYIVSCNKLLFVNMFY